MYTKPNKNVKIFVCQSENVQFFGISPFRKVKKIFKIYTTIDIPFLTPLLDALLQNGFLLGYKKYTENRVGIECVALSKKFKRENSEVIHFIECSKIYYTCAYSEKFVLIEQFCNFLVDLNCRVAYEIKVKKEENKITCCIIRFKRVNRKERSNGVPVLTKNYVFEETPGS